MEINIKPEDIDVYVKNAIMESTLGNNIKEGIEKALKELFSGYRNPVEDIMKRELERLVKEYLEQESVKPQVMLAIAKSITPEAVGQIVMYGCSELKRRYEDKY